MFFVADASLVDRLLAIAVLGFDDGDDVLISSNWLTLTGRGIKLLLLTLMGDSSTLMLSSSSFADVGGD
jgi:hypothetical protein